MAQRAEAIRKAYACPFHPVIPPQDTFLLLLSIVEALSEPEILSLGLADLEGFFLYEFVCGLFESRETSASAKYSSNKLQSYV